MDALVSVHSVLRWVVLAALLGAGTYGLVQAQRPVPFDRRVFAASAVVVDVQVAIGVALYFLEDGFEQGVFIAAIHPVLMIGGLAVAHASLGRARTLAEPRSGYRAAALGALFALIVITLGIPWARD